MGWDAYAQGPRGGEIRKITPFKQAAHAVQILAGTVDGLLDRGGLNCSSCGLFLQRATGESVYDPDGWNVEKVKRLAKEARWPEWSDLDNKEMWACWSAEYFLNTCAAEGLSIRFSY